LSSFHDELKLIISMIAHKFLILFSHVAIRWYILACLMLQCNGLRPYLTDLTSMRLQSHRLFLYVEINYGGPFNVRKSSSECTNIQSLLGTFYVLVHEGGVFVRYFYGCFSSCFGPFRFLWTVGGKDKKFKVPFKTRYWEPVSNEGRATYSRISNRRNPESYPLIQMYTALHDFCALTQDHFWYEKSLYTHPENDVTKIQLNRLSRWKLIRQCHQSF